MEVAGKTRRNYTGVGVSQRLGRPFDEATAQRVGVTPV